MSNGCLDFVIGMTLVLLRKLAFLFMITMVGCLLAVWCCKINPEVEYQWYFGIWHGLFIIPNWVMSWMIKGNTLYQAPIHTIGYIIWWWICLVFHCLTAFGFTFGGRTNNYD